MSKPRTIHTDLTEVSTQGVMYIIIEALAKYDVDLSDDLYIIRSGDIERVAWRAAEAYHRALLSLIEDRGRGNE